MVAGYGTCSLFFVMEMAGKMWYWGVASYLCGPDKVWNLFDGGMVALSFVDIYLSIANCGRASITRDTDIANSGATLSTRDTDVVLIVRALRLVRLSRLIRLIRMPVFAELERILNAMNAGLKSVGWAVVFLFVFVYLLGIILRKWTETFPSENRNVQDLFSTVPESMFTMFRCTIGDCATLDGQPLAARLQDTLGWPWSVFYSAMILFMTLFFFNTIIAVLVESTVTALKFNDEMGEQVRKKDVANKTKQWVKRLQREKLVPIEPGIDGDAVILRADFQNALNQREVQELLDWIPPSARVDLFDVLDANGDGRLRVSALVRGLVSLRGDASKGDAVRTNLALGNLMRMIQSLEHRLVLFQKRQLEAAKRLSAERQGEDHSKARGRPAKVSALV